MIKKNIKLFFQFLIKKFLILFDKKYRKDTLVTIVFLSILSLLFCVAITISKNQPSYVYVKTFEEFDAIRNNLDGDYFIAVSNLEIPSDWVPFGTKEQPFTGTLNGNGVTISLANGEYYPLSNDDGDYFGIVGYNQGTIKSINFYVHDLLINSDDNLTFGIVTAYNYGSISNCFTKRASGSININTNENLTCGSMAGIGCKNFIKTASNLAFDMKTSSDIIFGGIVGKVTSDLRMEESYSFVKSNFSVSSNSIIDGGFIGEISSNCSAASLNNLLSKYQSESYIENTLTSGFVSISEANKLSLSHCVFYGSISNNSNSKISGFLCDGSSEIEYSLFSGVFSNLINSRKSYFSFNNSSLKKCYFANKIEDIEAENCFYLSGSSITLDILNLNNKIWFKNNNGLSLRWVG